MTNIPEELLSLDDKTISLEECKKSLLALREACSAPLLESELSPVEMVNAISKFDSYVDGLCDLSEPIGAVGILWNIGESYSVVEHTSRVISYISDSTVEDGRFEAELFQSIKDHFVNAFDFIADEDDEDEDDSSDDEEQAAEQ